MKCKALPGLLLGAVFSIISIAVVAEETNAVSTNATVGAKSSSTSTNEAATKSNNAEVDAAWADVVASAKPPQPDKDLSSNDEVDKFNARLREAVRTSVTKVQAFRAKYPDYKKDEAEKLEKDLKSNAYRLGALDPVEESKPQPQKSEAEMMAEYNALMTRIDEARALIHKAAMAKQGQGIDAVLGELENGYRQLAQQAPQDSSIARDANSIISTRGLIRRLDSVGKPMDIKFTALDGREVDLAKLKGKVVLIDFWATWCMPCLMEIPNMMAAYERLHAKGFEIVSISLDEDKETVTRFIASKKIPWLQCYDRDYQFAARYGVGPIPAMWLVDKKGNLREFNGRFMLAEKVEKLLAE
jgi:thiol-disulfide isomerase/thioredoxin